MKRRSVRHPQRAVVRITYSRQHVPGRGEAGGARCDFSGLCPDTGAGREHPPSPGAPDPRAARETAWKQTWGAGGRVAELRAAWPWPGGSHTCPDSGGSWRGRGQAVLGPGTRESVRGASGQSCCKPRGTGRRGHPCGRRHHTGQDAPAVRPPPRQGPPMARPQTGLTGLPSKRRVLRPLNL